MDSCKKCKYQNANECRRNPPVPGEKTLDVLSYFRVWPAVQGDDWCGEFKPIPKKKEVSEKDKKLTYGEFQNVKLTNDERSKLIEKWGDEKTAKMIGKCSRYVESTGKHYKSHYATMLNWDYDNNAGGSQSGPEGSSEVVI